LYYTNFVWPQLHIEVYTINYYDDYSFGVPAELNLIGTENKTKTLSTGSLVRVLDTDSWITTVTFYDNKAQPIRVASKNDYLNTIDIVKYDLDFTGKPLSISSKHTKGDNAAIEVENYFTYDHVGRLLTETQKIGNQPIELITNNHYDKLGQLIQKNVGGLAVNSPENSEGLQTVNYDYNIRGWLKSINNGIADANNLFGFRISYNNTFIDGAIPLFNGNISETHWQTLGEDNSIVHKAYDYKYDALNRITRGNFHKLSVGEAEDYSLNSVSYDKNGNIITLIRTGLIVTETLVNGTPTETVSTDYIDKLSYIYEPKSNQLNNVNDDATQDGFKDGLGRRLIGENDYLYDINGNMTKDLNKDIIDIVYNHLNLPTKIVVEGEDEGGGIVYVYDATGVKLEKVVYDNSADSGKATQYAGNYIYEKNTEQSPAVLKFFSHSEGYVEPNEDNKFNYVYQYKDHLNNIRLSYSDSNNDGSVDASEIIEEKNYYPFGLKHKGYNNVVNGVHHPYGYLNQEENEELGLGWLSFRHRNYMPEIGRFFGIDPVAGDYVTISPYQFAHNNPVWKIELEGLEGHEINGVDVVNAPPSGQSGQNPASHLPLPVGDQSSGTTSGKKSTRKIVALHKYAGQNISVKQQLVTGYPGQSLDEAVTAGIQWIGSKLTGDDVSKQTSENVQLGTNLLVFIVSKGKNGKAGAEVTEQLLKKNADDLAEGITDINKAFSNGSQLNKGGLESAINSASYYDDVAEQGSSLFNSIVKGHIFTNGNKRTASEFITNFAKDNNLNINLNASQLKDLTSEIANGVKYNAEELAKKLFGN